ncbi:MAG: hypothetical protein ACOVQJ_07525 [Bacteroidia bacterium]|jgi:regulator of replication initiation timing
MQGIEQRLAAIKEKVGNLLQENLRLKEEVQSLTQTLEERERTIEIQKNTIGGLTERNKMIKLAKNLSLSGSDSFDVKIKINELVREIDRCIDLLNE